MTFPAAGFPNRLWVNQAWINTGELGTFQNTNAGADKILPLRVGYIYAAVIVPAEEEPLAPPPPEPEEPPAPPPPEPEEPAILDINFDPDPDPGFDDDDEVLT